MTAALYTVLAGIEHADVLLLLAAASLLVLAFGARFFPVIVHVPFIAGLAFCHSVLNSSWRRTLLGFLLPWVALMGGLVAVMGDKIWLPIDHGRKLSEVWCDFMHISRWEVFYEVLRGSGGVLFLILLGVWVLAFTRRHGSVDRSWPEPLAWLLSLAAPAYHLWGGHVFSIEKNLAATALVGAPVAALGLAVVFRRVMDWSRPGVVRALATGLLGSALLVLLVQTWRITVLWRATRWSDTADVHEWFVHDIRLPNSRADQEFLQVGADSNPWSLKKLQDWHGSGLKVSAKSAFSGESLAGTMAKGAAFVHCAYRDAQRLALVPREENEIKQRRGQAALPRDAMAPFAPEEWAAVRMYGYAVYRMAPNEAGYVNYVLVRRGTGVAVRPSPRARHLGPLGVASPRGSAD
jgi:hypothetical protein